MAVRHPSKVIIRVRISLAALFYLNKGVVMFYYLLSRILTYNYILIAAAVIPAAFLMVRVYQSDLLEKESPALLYTLMKAGILSSLLALVEERILSFLLYFCIVAIAEESSKYIFLKRNSWNSPEFNCLYDGVVYAVFVSLGFALWENISYVLNFGLTTAVARAVTAIPGHACFGVFMGIFYGIAKKYDYAGEPAKRTLFGIFTLLVPMLLHGAYDYIASMEIENAGWYFFGFVAVLFIVSYILVGNVSKKDEFIR